MFMVENSRLSKLPLKHLIIMVKNLIDDGFDFEDPYDDYEDNEKLLRDYCKMYGITPLYYLDIDFITEFYDSNEEIILEIIETDNKTLYSDIEIPKAKEYKIYTNVNGRCTFNETYSDTWSSYNKDLCYNSVRQAYSDGNYSYYDGTMVDSNYSEHEDYDEEIKIGDVVSESPLKRKTMIDKLDKKTLLELRGLIDKRLEVL